MDISGNLLGGPPPTLLPSQREAESALSLAGDPALAAARFPTYSAAWAALAERALEHGNTIEAYAYARTGYHRGLDALRANGWKGFGPIPWSHAPNRGFLRCLHSLGRAAAAIGETAEADRIRGFLNDSDPEVTQVLGEF
ncbi:MAG: hypothetical protein QOG65_3105 [Actinomycetota bacterium]|jgi:hypothetical protein|nr:hypothetical protein [Actinomycetota bacterium]MDQ1701707.1 hypothetical protein [Frankiaceae bacterium]